MSAAAVVAAAALVCVLGCAHYPPHEPRAAQPTSRCPCVCAHPPPPHPPTPPPPSYCRNLPPNYGRQDVGDMFLPFGAVLEIRL